MRTIFLCDVADYRFHIIFFQDRAETLPGPLITLLNPPEGKLARVRAVPPPAGLLCLSSFFSHGVLLFELRGTANRASWLKDHGSLSRE